MTPDLTALIAEAKRLHGLATEGPWIWEGAYADLYSVVDGKYGSVITDGERPDGTPCVACFDRDKEFIALSRTALPALVAEVERLQRVVDEIQGWNQVAAESNKAIDAFLREIDPDMPEHYGMPVDGIMQVVHKLRSGIESAFKEGFRAGYDAELDTNIESEWQWSDSAASVSAELKAREK